MEELNNKIKENNGKKINAIVIIIILMLSGIFMFFSNSKDDSVKEEDVNLIAENSVLYVQTGCSHCITQENIFGDYISKLNIIDCVTEDGMQKCINANITATPTWIIKGKYYEGIKTIEELKEIINKNE
jgi:hypothetical protein